jgi:hypothetical protein
MRPPITNMPGIDPAAPTPVTGRPVHPDCRRLIPISRHPIIVTGIIIPGPITRDPDISVHRTRWLHINRNSRRRKMYGYPDAHLCTRSCSPYGKG